MVKKRLNKAEISYLNSLCLKNYKQYDLSKILDMLPNSIWVGDENNGCTYNLNFTPGYRDLENISSWNLSYYNEEDENSVLVTFGSNDGLVVCGFKMLLWILKYTTVTDYFRKYIYDILEKQQQYDAMNDIDIIYKRLNK